MKTIEEKAKAYDKAVEKIKYVMEHGFSPVLNKEDLQDIFPQLKESDDERIRKEIIKIFNVENFEGYNVDNAEAIEWLKKQKPAEWSEEDEKILKSIINDLSQNVVPDKEDIDWLKSLKDRYTWTTSDEDKKMLDFAIRAVGLCKQYAINHQVNGYSKLPDVPKRYEELQNWLKSLKERVQPQPKQEWSEEDEKIYKSITYSFAHNYPLTVQQQEFVKSIRSQNTWKPSDSQMASITCAVRKMKESACYDSELVSLLNDLKKLKRE